jgi:CheY-like chemotaxis protein
MDAAVRARIFEPFFTTKPTGRGTGLGLAAVLGVLGQNHGFITVTSTQRKGSTFTVYLPAATNPPPANRRVGPQRGRTEYGAPSGTILVVDDEDALRAVVARILQREGYRVLQASGGNEALELIERLGPPDLLLTDVRMPGLNGVGLAQALQARYPTVPIIFMSGYSSEELARLGTPITTARLLSKPFAPGELTLGVAAMLSRAGGSTAVVRAG